MSNDGKYLELCLRLRKERKKQHFTQKSFAEALNVSQTHIYHLERGDRFPSLPLLIHIAEVLNVSIDYLLIGRNETHDKLDLTIASLTPQQRDLFADILRSIGNSIDIK